MGDEVDDEFYERADAHIKLSNDQMANARRGVVSASMMYATARFNAYVSACNASSKQELADKKEQTIEYFTNQYRLVLAENIDDYVARYDESMKVDPQS